MQKDKAFPQRVQLSERRVGFLETEIIAWAKSREPVEEDSTTPSEP
jgi:predicted DNA-binding transcriptional regulator AlpA